MPVWGSNQVAVQAWMPTSRFGLVVWQLLLACSVLFVCVSHAQGLSTERQANQPQRGYFVDPTGQMALAEVQNQTFESFDRALSLGYTPDTVWLRLRVEPNLGVKASELDSNRVVLRLTNPLLNDVRLYDPLQNNGQPIITGDAHPNTQTELDLSSLTFLLPRGLVPRDVYVSVQTTSSMVFSVVLEPVEQALKHNRTYDLFGGLYLGLLVVFFVLAVALRIGRADRVTNWFLVQQGLAIAWSLTLMGYTRQYIAPWLNLSSVDALTNLTVVVYTFSVCQYGMVFLGQFKLHRWVRPLVYAPAFVFAPLVILVVLGHAGLALWINAMFVICFSVLGLLIVLVAVDWQSDLTKVLPRWLVTLFFVVFGLAIPLATSVTLRVEPVFQNAFVGFFFTTAIAGVLMSTLLLYRARAQTREAIAAAMALSLQQQRSQEQAKFLGMLAHEFKTPLSIIKMVTGSGQLDTKSSNYSADAIRNIDALLEKCLQAEALLDTSVVSEPLMLDVAELVADVVANSAHPGAIEIQAAGKSEIRSDPTLVRIVLANLVDNALKYGQAGSRVSVDIRQNQTNQVVVRVTNDVGQSGVPDPAFVFDKYYRAPGALSQSGSGLGLYLSKHIATLLGGDLVFAPGKQALWFEVQLPKQI